LETSVATYLELHKLKKVSGKYIELMGLHTICIKKLKENMKHMNLTEEGKHIEGGKNITERVKYIYFLSQQVHLLLVVGIKACMPCMPCPNKYELKNIL